MTLAETSELRAHSRVQRFPRGTAVLAERQVGDRVMMLLAGRVKVTCITGDGREVVLGFCGPGDLIGELAALDGQPRSGGVTALETVETLTVGTADFQAFLGRHPRVAMLVMRMLTERLRDSDRKRIEFAAADTTGRVAARLVELAGRFGVEEEGAVVIDLPLTQEELAGWCGASREATAKALHTLRSLGWVDTARRRLTVNDLSSLRARAA